MRILEAETKAVHWKTYLFVQKVSSIRCIVEVSYLKEYGRDHHDQNFFMGEIQWSSKIIDENWRYHTPTSPTHSIHPTGIFTYMKTIQIKHSWIGIYTSPIDSMDKMSPCSSVFTQQDALVTTHSHSIMIMKVSLVNESASIHVLRRSTESNRNGNNKTNVKSITIHIRLLKTHVYKFNNPR